MQLIRDSVMLRQSSGIDPRLPVALLFLAVILALVVCALLARFVFPEELTRLVEQILPGYTIQWN